MLLSFIIISVIVMKNIYEVLSWFTASKCTFVFRQKCVYLLLSGIQVELNIFCTFSSASPLLDVALDTRAHLPDIAQWLNGIDQDGKC